MVNPLISACPIGDLNGDCVADWQDIEILHRLWLTEAPPPSASLVSRWSLDGDTDDSVGGNDFTINGDPQWVTRDDQMAMEFDGDGDYLSCPDDPSLNLTNNFTVGLWVKLDNGSAVLCKGSQNPTVTGGAYSIGYGGPDAFIFIARNNTNTAPALAFAPANKGEWTHLAATFSNGNMILYKNGEEAATATLSTTTVNTNTDPLVIGAETDGPAYLTGSVDDIQIYNTVLTGADIIAMSVPAFNGDLDTDGKINTNEFTLVADKWKQTGNPDFILGDDTTVTACSGTGQQETANYAGLIKGLHDTATANMWQSAPGGAGGSNPNTGTEAGAAWIKYEFDRAYDIKNMWIWNYNQAGATNNGMRNVAIEYSTDGVSYTKLGDYEIPQAFGVENMPYNFEVDFGDIIAKYVVVTAKISNGNWGGSHYGLSEVRFNYSESSLEMSVARSMPQRGASCPLIIEELDAYNTTPASRIDFYVQYDGDAPVLVSQETVALGSSYNWVPTQNGPYKVWAQFQGKSSTVHEVFVTEKELHFTFWSMRTDLKYITGYQYGDQPYPTSKTLLYRGVYPLGWKNGYNAGLTDIQYKNAWQTLGHWTAKGILIDEFSANNDAIDDAMGRGLTMLRAAEPDMYLAPAIVAIQTTASDDMIDGLAVADTVLIETYANDFRFLDNRFSRYAEGVDRGLGHNAVAAVAYTFVTTVSGMCEQIEYARSKYPDMPGLFLYGTASSVQFDVLDQTLYDYYLGPAVRPEVVASNLEVRNIGSLTAEDVNVIFHTTSGDTVTQISSIAADATTVLALPAGYQSFEIEEAPGRYTVVNYVSPDTLPPPDAEANADAAAYRATYTSGSVLRPFEGTVNFNYGPNLAELDLAETVSGRVAMAFDFDLLYSAIYPGIKIRLGEGTPYEMSFEIQRHEQDSYPGVTGSGPRAHFIFKDTTLSGPHICYEVFPPSMNIPDGKYHFFAAYDPAEKSFRAMMLQRTTGALMWDTGFIPATTYNQNPSHSKLLFEANVFNWDDTNDELFMQSGGATLIGCEVRNIEIMH